jgi:hypothetical protein
MLLEIITTGKKKDEIPKKKKRKRKTKIDMKSLTVGVIDGMFETVFSVGTNPIHWLCSRPP